MTRALVVLLTLAALLLGCGEEAEPASPAASAPAKRRSPIAAPALIAQANRLAAQACACTTQKCAERTLSRVAAYGHRHLGVSLDAKASAEVRRRIDSASACVRELLN